MEQTIFENIKHLNEYGNEYWSARELYKILEYTEYTKFLPTVKKSEIACKTS
jgi:DNA-damage-inducible protein D